MSISALLVEDEPKAQLLLLNLLRLYCPRVAVLGVASSLPEARRFLDQNEVQILFLDIHLQGENGLRLLDVETEAMLQVYVVITSANAEYRDAAASRSKTAFLQKPIQISELTAIIDAMTD